MLGFVVDFNHIKNQHRGSPRKIREETHMQRNEIERKYPTNHLIQAFVTSSDCHTWALDKSGLNKWAVIFASSFLVSFDMDSCSFDSDSFLSTFTGAISVDSLPPPFPLAAGGDTTGGSFLSLGGSGGGGMSPALGLDICVLLLFALLGAAEADESGTCGVGGGGGCVQRNIHTERGEGIINTVSGLDAPFLGA